MGCKKDVSKDISGPLGRLQVALRAKPAEWTIHRCHQFQVPIETLG